MMAVPDFQSFFLPLLEFAADGQEHTISEAREALAVSMEISDADRSELLPGGTQSRFDNRVAWAKSYFVQAKVLESPRRGRLVITDRGKELLRQGHERIDIHVLGQYPEFVEFRTRKKGGEPESSTSAEDETPEETLQRVQDCVPDGVAPRLFAQ